MWHHAKPSDLNALHEFLAPRVATSMFLSGNLAAYGLAGDHPKSMTLWFTQEAGQITNVIGYARAGYVVFEVARLEPRHAAGLRAALFGRSLLGLNGAADQAALVLAALDLPVERAALDAEEPHFRLTLSDLHVPDGQTRLRPAQDDDLPNPLDWRIASEVEILGGRDNADNRRRGRQSLEELLALDRLRVLEADGLPVAMTNFNAGLDRIMQVGGVYTPPELRNRGYARRAVALHLEEARAQGVEQAILFASNAAASRAYEAIGFYRIGTYRLINFDPAIRMGEPT